MSDTNFKGNITTIVKFVVMMVAPYFGVAEATQNQWIAVIVAVIGLILAYFDAKYDNTLINQPNVNEVVEEQVPSELEQQVLQACQEEDAINPEYTASGDDGGA